MKKIICSPRIINCFALVISLTAISGCLNKTTPLHNAPAASNSQQGKAKPSATPPPIKPWKFKTMGEVAGDKKGMNGQPVIPVDIYNKGNYAHALVVADTGWYYSTISRSLAKRLEMKATSFADYAKTKHVPVANIGYIKIGDTWFSGEVMILEDKVMKHDLNISDGIFGTDILSDTRIMMDVPKKQMWITSHSIPVKDAAVVDLIPLKPKKAKGYTVGYIIDVSVNGKKRSFLLDTGSYHTSIDKRFLPKGVVQDSPCYEDSGAFGSVKTCDAFVDMQIADVKFPHLKIGVDQTPLASVDSGTVDDKGKVLEEGILGMDILSQKRIVLDFPNHKMYIAR